MEDVTSALRAVMNVTQEKTVFNAQKVIMI